MRMAEIGGGRRSRYLPNMEDEVVLIQPVVVGLNQCGFCPLQLLPGDAGGVAFKVYLPDPATGQLNQRVPVARKRKLKHDAQDAVIVVLDLALQPFAALQNQRLDRLHDRRTLIAHVARRRVLEGGLLLGSSSKNLP